MSADLQPGHIPQDLRALPRCDLTDLPRLICGCPEHQNWAFDEDDLTPAELDYLNGNIVLPAIPAYRDYHLLRVDYQSREWKYLGLKHVPDLIVCEHAAEGTTLCFPCAVSFRGILLDIPGLVADLLVAFTKDTAFAERGTLDTPYPEEEDEPDFEGPWTEEAGIQWNPAASRALTRLHKALGGPPAATTRYLLTEWRGTLRRPDLGSLATSVSSAARYAFRVIERPPTYMNYGTCPHCGKTIHQERVDPHDTDGRIRCNDCGYSALAPDHQKTQLDLAADQRFTEQEILRLLKEAGEGVARWEFTNLVYPKPNSGLTPISRDKGLRRRWRGSKLEDYTVHVYRLGEVRESLRERRRAREMAS